MFKATLQAMALAAALVAAPAHAVLTPNGAVDCTASADTDNLALNPTFTDCSGAFDGNNSNLEADVLATISADFGLTGLTNIFDVSGSAGTSGSFDLSGIDGPFVLALKAGNAFSLYAFSDGEVIEWDTLGVGFFAGPNVQVGNGLSHATVYASSVVAVPEPETYALIGAGLAFVGWASRRRQRRV